MNNVVQPADPPVTPRPWGIDIQKLGQSLWYDHHFNRALICSGELRQLVEGGAIAGAVANLAGFERAIRTGVDYDKDIAGLAEQGATARSIFDQLAIADIQGAADVLDPLHRRSRGLEGYVSVPVAPTLAHDGTAVLREARRLHQAMGRKNVMLALPATPECVPAMRRLINEGIHVNATQLYSPDAVKAVVLAYMQGLAERAVRGFPLDVTMVASFHVGRVDSLVDEWLDRQIAFTASAAERCELIRLKGRAGVATARLACQGLKGAFKTLEWPEMMIRGARPLRLLWTDTAVRSATLRDTHYLDALIGAGTASAVCAVSPATLAAFIDHGMAAPVPADPGESTQVIESLRRAGIDIAPLCQRQLRDAVYEQAETYRRVLEAIEGKRKRALLAANPAVRSMWWAAPVNG